MIVPVSFLFQFIPIYSNLFQFFGNVAKKSYLCTRFSIMIDV